MTILNAYKAEKDTGDYLITSEVVLLEQDDVYFTSATERTTGCGTSKVWHYCSADYFDVHQARARFIQDVKHYKKYGYTTKEIS